MTGIKCAGIIEQTRAFYGCGPWPHSLAVPTWPALSQVKLIRT